MSTRPPFSAEMSDGDHATAQIWSLSGKMMGGTCCYDFLETVRDNIKKGQNQPILDLTEVTLANSTGLGVLASIFTAAKDAGGMMHLVSVNDRVKSVLKVINLWYVVSPCDSVEEALTKIDQG